MLGILSTVVLMADNGQRHLFEHLGTENGLSHSHVSGMLKDRQGFMWFATWDGLNRYDGNAFVTFKPGDNHPGASNRIDGLSEDGHGNIWVTTVDRKAYRLNRLTERFEALPPLPGKPTPPTIGPLTHTPRGDTWIILPGHGACRIVTNPTNNQTTVESFNEQSSIPLPDNHVTHIIEDTGGSVWLAGAKSVTCLSQDSVNHGMTPVPLRTMPSYLHEQGAITAVIAGEQAVWMGTDKGLLLRFDTQTRQLKTIPMSSSAAITTLACDNQGKLLAGTQQGGIAVVNEASGSLVHHYHHPAIGHVLKLYVDSRGLIWVETRQPGIVKIDPTTGLTRHYQQPLDVAPDLRPTAQCGMMEDETHRIWLTLKGGGFGYYDPEHDHIAYFHNRPGDPQSKVSNFVNCFYKEASGTLWLSTYFKGIEKVTFARERFRFVQPTPQANLSIANEVRALLYDHDGLLWVATKKQELFVLDSLNRIVKKITLTNTQQPGMVYALLHDHQGNIYAGTKGNGLFKLTRRGKLDYAVSHYRHHPDDAYSLSNDNIYALRQDNQGRIWIATYGGGLNLMDGERFINPGNEFGNYPDQQGLKVRHLAQDRQGNLWLGTTDGLMLAQPHAADHHETRFTLFTPSLGNTSGLLSNDVFQVLCNSGGTLYVTTLGGGLSILKETDPQTRHLTFETLTQASGLPSNMIFTLAEDDRGQLWMSTENGICAYEPTTKTINHFGRHDGIANTAFSEGAVARRYDGTISFGTNKGLYTFHPLSIDMTSPPGKLTFTSLHLMGKAVKPSPEGPLHQSMTQTDHLELTHQQNLFTIGWTTLNSPTTDRPTYEYYLEGYDREWRPAGTGHQADYSHVPPGKYNFHVRFSNPALQAVNATRSLRITIRPPAWKSTPAMILYLVVAIVLGAIIRRFFGTILKLRHKVAVEKELTDIKLNFFTNLSHELRTPLTLILGPAEELRHDTRLPSRAHDMARLIEDNANRLLRIVTQLLDFRKMESGKMPLTLIPVDMNVLTERMCAGFKALTTQKGIVLTHEPSPTPCILNLDAEKTESVLTNLLANAIAHTPNEGHIRLVVQDADASKQPSVAIIDNGTGIAPELAPNLFEVFASHRRPTRNDQPGTGIGLAYSRAIMRQHGGDLVYRPTPGGGATFIMLFEKAQRTSDAVFTPLTEATPTIEPMQATEATPPLPDHKKVLIVEDNADLRRFIRQRLEPRYRVEEAEDGRQALEKARTWQPDLILTDVMMPVMDGIELLRALKEDFDTSHLPVVLLTSRASVESRIQGLRYGADAYLTKPFNMQQLEAQLDNLIRQRDQLRQCYTQQPAPAMPQPGLTERDQQFLDQVRAIVAQHLSDPDFKIADLYSELAMGRSKFFDKLKGLTGLSPIDFVKESRLEKARQLLETTNHNVTETAYLTGFSDSGYFSKCYKERFGVNPSQVGK